jgi:hypothetical protein
MTDIYVLQGIGSCGKSQTVSLIFSMLKKKYPSASVQIMSRGRVDITVIMDINGIKVGIESQGDPGGRQVSSLDTFFKNNCAIVICAARTRGMTVDWINAYVPPHQATFIPQPWCTSGVSATNSKTAASIISSAGL